MVHVISRSFLMGILLVATVLWSSGQGLAPRPGKKVILHAAKLLDVKSGTTLSDPVAVIEGDKITTVGPANSTRIPAEAERIDLPGATLLPGLIDCYVHLTTHPTLFGPAGLHISYSRSALIGARNARTTLEVGFTTVPTSPLMDLPMLHFATPSMQEMCPALVCLSPDLPSVSPGGTGTKTISLHSLPFPKKALRMALMRSGRRSAKTLSMAQIS